MDGNVVDLKGGWIGCFVFVGACIGGAIVVVAGDDAILSAGDAIAATRGSSGIVAAVGGWRGLAFQGVGGDHG